MTSRARTPKRRPAQRPRTSEHVRTVHPVRRRRPTAVVRPSSLPLNVLVQDIMTRDVVTIGTGATLYEALVLMRTRLMSGFPVRDETGAVVSLISQADIARALNVGGGVPEVRGILDLVLAGFEQGGEPVLRSFRERLEQVKVREVVGGTLISIDPESTVESAAEAMNEQNVHRLPVLRGNHLVGIVTRHDIIRALVPVSSKPRPIGR